MDLQFKRQNGTPAIAIQLLPEALAAAGLKVQDVAVGYRRDRLRRQIAKRSVRRFTARGPSTLRCCCPTAFVISPPRSDSS